MKKRNKKYPKWNIILSSGPGEAVRRFQLSKSLFVQSLVIIGLLPLVITGLMFQMNHLANEKEVLYATIEEKDSTIKQKDNEIAGAKEEYSRLQEDVLDVQLTIEEFKAFESQLNELELEIPSEVEDVITGSSGGMEFPESTEDTGSNVTSTLVDMKSELPKLINSFEQTVERIAEYEEKLRTTPTIFPAAEGRITSRFGNRRDPFTAWTRFHSGIDIAAPLNTPIYAGADGTVIHAGSNGGYGLTVMIKHSGTYETLYAHLNHIDVEVGDKVTKGDQIGGMGTTGRSTGVHLHYEIKRNGELIDPYTYITFHQGDSEE
ncbi:M23 family metallopeptidase [Evansella tamaricis]|uniref:Peptidoglycan DD-metalloendopeptidase family protein n=1 Tax=Evansella tamaricis TaxID=2069301 RepID=A0ABS6JGJ6_9BACI|nr:M23 family metallopeptidase [Evansella tamaricis]MBU9712344.1 peptidoglycan DD-metalloendopeptidase family protein [Evansella tamaricis]